MSGSVRLALFGALLGALLLPVGCRKSSGLRSGGPGPARPTRLAAAAGDGEVVLTWNRALKSSTHNIYWSTTPGVTPVTGTPILDVASPYTHGGLINGTAYYYVVVGAKGAGEGPPSEERAATPFPAPMGLFAAASDGRNTLTWNPVPGALTYNIYWNTVPGVTPATGNLIPGVQTGQGHTGLTNGVTYWYVVTAVTATGDGAPSPPASGRPSTEVATVWLGGQPITFLTVEHYYSTTYDISGVLLIGSVPLGWSIDIWWFGDVDPGCTVDSCGTVLFADIRSPSGANYWENPCLEDVYLCLTRYAAASGGRTTGIFFGEAVNINPPGDVITIVGGEFTGTRR